MRSKLVEALKPDRDTIDKIASDKQLSTGAPHGFLPCGSSVGFPSPHHLTAQVR